MIDIKIQEVFDYFYSPEIRWRDAIWRGATLKGIQYYYAEEGLYIFPMGIIMRLFPFKQIR